MKAINIIARTISGIFSPLLVPTYAIIIALWSTYLVYASLSTRVAVAVTTFVATCVLPIIGIYVLTRKGLVSDPHLNDRRERFFPLVFAVICYVGLAFYLASVHSPTWLSMFVVAAAVSALIVLLVSTRWKISAHATSMGGCVAFLFFITFRGDTVHNNEWLFIVGMIVAGLVMTSRLILNRHTLAQVVAGFANGAIVISLFQVLATYF